VDRSQLPNAFEFVVIASARAKQLMRGCLPRVSSVEKPARLAQREVFTGAVERIPDKAAVEPIAALEEGAT
jgi:DNA-directed RNA polymerase subunit K/omega